MVSSLSILGLRGYSERTIIEFAKPNGSPGSGITVFVGANNTGKTTILEALQLFNSSDGELFLSEGKRNISNQGKVAIELTEEMGGKRYVWSIHSSADGGAATTILQNGTSINYSQLRQVGNDDVSFPAIYVLQSHRFMNSEFGKNSFSRNDYLRFATSNGVSRLPTLSNFEGRLFKMNEKKKEIAPLIDRAFGARVDWHIEQRDNGNYYLKFSFGDTFHSLDGAGDGLWNVFTLCDSLYDAPDGSMVVIDEPEQSLHPQLQKRIMSILMEEAKTKQIVISTHSPYFIEWESLANGGALYRFSKDSEGGCHSHRLNDASVKWIKSVLKDTQKPHTLGLDTKEIFFLDDRVVVCEGQDDVVMLQRIAQQLETTVDGEFFGWGAGGSGNIPKVLAMLECLGFRNVIAVFDANVQELAERCRSDFPLYRVICIPTDDIRDKDAVPARDEKTGMVKQNGELKDEYRKEAEAVIQSINDFFHSQCPCSG